MVTHITLGPGDPMPNCEPMQRYVPLARMRSGLRKALKGHYSANEIDQAISRICGVCTAHTQPTAAATRLATAAVRILLQLARNGRFAAGAGFAAGAAGAGGGSCCCCCC